MMIEAGARSRAAAGVVVLGVALAALGCGRESGSARGRSASATSGGTASVPGRFAVVPGFKTPESVRYDSALDIYFVANIDGNPAEKDGNGFISRMTPDGAIDSLHFVAGGRGGVTLNAPKGMAIVGDTLWVADIDAVRAFNVRTGAPVASVDLSKQGAIFLNDITTGPDGALYVTDMAVKMSGGASSHPPNTDRIFRIAPDHGVSVALQSDSLGRPNGITWDASARRFIIASYGGTKRILAWRPGTTAPTAIGFGAGQFDGVELLPDHRLLITSWTDSTVSIRDANRQTMIRDLPSPADIGVDTRRMRVAVPLLTKDRVEIFTIPPQQGP